MKIVQQGILLRKVNYSESSLILSFYTREKGIQSFIFQGAKKKKGNLLQPLTMVEIESYSRADSELGKITSISPLYVFQSIPFHPIKSGIAFFMAETLTMCLKSSDTDERLFVFIKEQIEGLDTTENIAHFPITFLISLAKQLGFEPMIIGQNPQFLDVIDGELLDHQPTGHIFIKDDTIPLLVKLLKLSNQSDELILSKLHRQQLVQNLLFYFRHHVEGFNTPKSLAVLQAVYA